MMVRFKGIFDYFVCVIVYFIGDFNCICYVVCFGKG